MCFHIEVHVHRNYYGARLDPRTRAYSALKYMRIEIIMWSDLIKECDTFFM